MHSHHPGTINLGYQLSWKVVRYAQFKRLNEVVHSYHQDTRELGYQLSWKVVRYAMFKGVEFGYAFSPPRH